MDAHDTPALAPLPGAMHDLLRTIDSDSATYVMLHGSPFAVARIQAMLEAIDPSLSTSRGVGLMDGDCASGRVLLYWSLPAAGENRARG